jgi:hypothetical protein
LALGVVDVVKWGKAITPDQKTALLQWLNAPLPDLAMLDGLTHRLFVAIAQDDTVSLDQVASHLPITVPSKHLTGLSQWVWMNGMLNEQYNHVTTSLASETTPDVSDATKRVTPQALFKWATKRPQRQAIQSTVPTTPP